MSRSRPLIVVGILASALVACSSAPDHEAPLPDGGYLPLSGCSKSNLSALMQDCRELIPYDSSIYVCMQGRGPDGESRSGRRSTGLMPPASDPLGLNYSVDLCNAQGLASFMDCAGSICRQLADYNLATYNPVVLSIELDAACSNGTRVAGEDSTCAANCETDARNCTDQCPLDDWDHCAACANACSLTWRKCDQACPHDTDSCDNGVKDSDETDVDCGGSHCMSSCETGQHCAAATDCISQVCKNGTCAAATCTDGVQNGFEFDVDCGGTCPATCQAGQKCYKNKDCKSGQCGNLSPPRPGTCQ